jgi:hypothetical protein
MLYMQWPLLTFKSCSPCTSMRRCDELLEECRRLQDAGHRAAAKRALAAAKEFQQLLTHLERAIRPR